MMDNNLPGELKQLKFLKDAHGRICLYPSIGDFIGQQYVPYNFYRIMIFLTLQPYRILLDLNMTPHFLWSEQEWAALGPGSSACLRKMFGPTVARYEQEALRYLFESQMSHFTRLGITRSQVPRLCDARPAGVSAIDIEHALCECEKYCRGKFPHIKGKRTQVGRPYSPSPDQITADLPDHWTHPRLIPPPPSQPPAIETNGGIPYYEVSHIVADNSKNHDGSRRYLVRWVGYGPEDDWWMDEGELTDSAPELLKKWNAIKDRIAKSIAQLRNS